MKHSFLDRYSELGSFIHKLDPRTKIVTTFIFVLAVVLTPPPLWQAFVLYLAIIATAILISRVPPLYIIKRSLVIIPFVLFIGIFIPFLRPGDATGSYNIWIWDVSNSGLVILWGVVIKSWLSVICLILLTATTRFTELLNGLEQLYFPKIMIMILSFMYRYIFVLVDEVIRMKQARDSRNFGGRQLQWLKTIGNMVGTLFIRSYERGERVYAAMVARGFEGQMRTLSRLRFRMADLYFAAAFCICMMLVGFTFLFF